ncbi:MAG: bifunctional response regulator/alkaline phosphatase family protein [Candidatus Eisenbacteria bacterium]|jgi:DNA-binding response OmpR family regulator|nr:bifunctional response regulator/alkaline phosphatase family protein [Candidatus Eisenbacteria bacterium]
MTTPRAYRVLWVDDEIDMLRPHLIFLEQKGYIVRSATNGDDAIHYVQRESFDLVLLDKIMAGRDGLSTLEEIKTVNSSLPVIMITKSEDDVVMDQAIAKRIDDFLIKPLNPMQVYGACRRILERARIRETTIAGEFAKAFGEMQSLRRTAAAPNDWIRLAVLLAEWDLRLDGSTDEAMKQAQREHRRECNLEFCNYVADHYANWTRGRDAPVFSVDLVRQFVAPHLKAGRRVVLVIIDGLRLDQWMAVEPLLRPFYNIKRHDYYSVLPTATPYARNGIFSGLFPAEIAEQYPAFWPDASADESSRNRFERELLGELLRRLGIKLRQEPHYQKVFTAQEAEVVRRSARQILGRELSTLVYSFVDILTHGRSQSEILKEIVPDETAFRSLTRSWFSHSALFEFLKDLSEKDNLVVVTSDHGSILCLRSTKVFGNKDTSTNVRYKYGRNLGCNDRQAVHVTHPREYRLPTDNLVTDYLIAREDYYFVYPTRFREFERQYFGGFQHGGISLEEMIVPLAVMESR